MKTQVYVWIANSYEVVTHVYTCLCITALINIFERKRLMTAHATLLRLYLKCALVIEAMSPLCIIHLFLMFRVGSRKSSHSLLSRS